MANVIEYYDAYNEDIRLIKDKVHNIEYATTVHILKDYIKEDMSILDVGAGTGRYSFYYASEGSKVTAIDIVPKHINIMNEKLNKNSELNVDIRLGNAMDLSDFSHDSFDVVLCFGPMYHLKLKEERDRCINECLRVLKKGGILATAYINKLFVAANLIKRDKVNCLKEGFFNGIIDEGMAESDGRDAFLMNSYFFLPDEIEEYINSFHTEKLEHVGTDGIGMLLSEMINGFNNEEYGEWMKYHYKTCREPSALGYSNHGLYVCRKK